MIRKNTSSGAVATFAGAMGTSGTVNGTRSPVRLGSPYGLCIDSKGNMYVSEVLQHSVLKIITAAFTLSPDFPAGLSFDNVTGEISGTPTVSSPSTSYSIQAFNFNRSSNVFTLNITVNAAVPVLVLQLSNDRNYIITYTPREAGITTDAAVIAATANRDKIQPMVQYFD